MSARFLLFVANGLFRVGWRKIAWRILSRVKKSGAVIPGVDLLRARIALARNPRNAGEAFQCVLEELRAFPQNAAAQQLRDRLRPEVFPKKRLGDEEFQRLYERVFLHTMMSQERLHCLYSLALRCVEDGIPGDFVECGVAAGGGSAVLAYVAAKDGRIDRKVYSCDTFEGMPQPGAKDTSNGVAAEATGWGSGTCRGGLGSLREISEALGVADRIEPVQGRFEETLPGLSRRLGSVALLHADGDWYSSTEAIFGNLYDKVEEGGAIQIDDYGHWKGCADAVHDFEAARGVRFALHRIDATGRWLWKSNAPYSSRKKGLGLRCNLGCGSQAHPDWLNFDLGGPAPWVVPLDLKAEQWPLPEESVDLVYSSHVLEHFARGEGESFLRKVHAILKPGGGLRLTVPDLEGLAESYLACVRAARASGDDRKAMDRHEWSVIELIDQMVRELPGGEMLRFWCERPVRAEDFVIERLGDEPLGVLRAAPPPQPRVEPFAQPREYFAFRNGGEVHKWMYDEISLKALLRKIGFEEVTRTGFNESSFHGFEWWDLDAGKQDPSRARKPDSLFIEARKRATV